MANDFDMLKDITHLEKNKATNKQAEDLHNLYFNKYVEDNPVELERLKVLYIAKYGFLDNYV